MKKSEKVPERRMFLTTNESENSLQHSTVTSNQVTNQTTCMDQYYHQHLYRGGDVNRAFRTRPVDVVTGDRGAAAGRNLDRQPFAGCCLHPAETRQSSKRAVCCSWGRGPNQYETMGNKDRGDEFKFQRESDEDELELPLPLRSEDEWENPSAFLPPRPHTHTNCGGGQYSFDADCRHQPQPRCHSAPCRHNQPWEGSPNWSGYPARVSGSSVSVNMPHFSIPAAEDVSEVSVMTLNSCVSLSDETMRSRLPDESRNIFITYSSDASSRMVPFIDFLTKHGFRPTVDISDNSVRHYLNNPSILIIVAISPQYKADVDGFVLDSHGLHTKYIHSMMQNEFIHQGSLNFRFIPVLFLNASQKHVPNWLQNTCVHRWPQDNESLLLRLLREERYLPPPVPVELTLVIKPVAPSSADP